MPSFQLSVSPHRRAAAKFISEVHRKLQRAYAERPDVTQTAIADALGVHRSVINRQIRGHQDMTLGRVGELAWALGLEPEFVLKERENEDGANEDHSMSAMVPFQTIVSSSTAIETKNERPRTQRLVLEDA